MQVVFSPLALSDVGTGLDARESLYFLSQVLSCRGVSMKLGVCPGSSLCLLQCIQEAWSVSRNQSRPARVCPNAVRVHGQVCVCALWRSNLAEILSKNLEAGGGVEPLNPKP